MFVVLGHMLDLRSYVEYNRDERAAGEVKYTFKKLVKLALDGLFDFQLSFKNSYILWIFVSFLSFLAGIFYYT